MKNTNYYSRFQQLIKHLRNVEIDAKQVTFTLASSKFKGYRPVNDTNAYFNPIQLKQNFDRLSIVQRLPKLDNWPFKQHILRYINQFT